MITIKNDELTVQIKQTGAELHSIKRTGSFHEYLWQGDDASWGRQAPTLFPFVGRLKNNQYTFNGHTYHQTQHGFARDCQFVVVQHLADQVTLRLTDTSTTRKVYPFRLSLTVTYHLQGGQLLVSYRVTNPDNQQTMLYALGAHPGFNVPLSSDVAFENVDLSVSPAETYPRIKLVGPYNDMQHPTTIDFQGPHQLNHQDFSEDALILVTNYQPLTVSLTEPSSGHGVHVHVDQTPFVGIWSPYPQKANLICIEPWWGIADNLHADGNLNHKNVMHRLAGGKTDEYHFSIEPF